MTFYCDAKHPNASDGCYNFPNHPGQHYSIPSEVIDGTHPDGEWEHGYWYWGEDAPGPLTFTDEELAILITALQPVKHFFPDLEAKLTAAREALK